MLRYLSAGSGQERKNGLGGRRNPLKRLDSDKEIKGFPLIFFGAIWPGLGKFGIGFGKPNRRRPRRPPPLSPDAGDDVRRRRVAPARGRVRRRLRVKEAPSLCELQKKISKQLKGLSMALNCTRQGGRVSNSSPKDVRSRRARHCAREPTKTMDGEQSVRANGISAMNDFKIRLSLSTFWIAALMALVLCGPTPSRAQQFDPAARHIQSYYQQLMPTLRQAGQLSVRERDQRFGPAITSAFDIATMTRLATGPAWSSFSGAQQAAVREAFARFLVADYASEVTDYSGESFVVDPQTSPEVARRRRNRQDQAAPARRADRDDQLSRSRRAGDRCLSERHGERPCDATRRIRLDPRRRRRRERLGQQIARTDRDLVGGLAWFPILMRSARAAASSRPASRWRRRRPRRRPRAS